MRASFLLALLLAPSAAAQTIRPIVPTMIRVPAGSFVAGSIPAETDAVHYPAINAARE